MSIATTPRDAWEHARRLLPGRVLRLAFADEHSARAFRQQLYRARAAERELSYADLDPAAWDCSAWDGLEITLRRPQIPGESCELWVARRAASANSGPIEISVERAE